MTADSPKTLHEAERERAELEAQAIPAAEREGARASTGATSPGGFSSSTSRAMGGVDDIYRTTGIDPTTVDGKPRAKA